MEKELLFRCLMNVISNAVEYTPREGKIKFYTLRNEGKIKFIIIDSGKGFSKEDIVSSKKQFYMGDKSRNSKNHFGMGLYIADSIAKIHNGNIILENSTETKGGKVTVELLNL